MKIEELETATKEGKYIVDFYADWCGPCKAIAPTLEKLNEEGEIKVIKINVDHADPTLLSTFGVRSIPTLVAIENGTQLNRAVGVQSKEKLVEMFS